MNNDQGMSGGTIIECACPCGCHDQNNTQPSCAWYSATTCGLVFECQRCTAPDTEPAPPNYPAHPYACTCTLCEEA